MIRIDGAHGEGGGQIVRSSLVLSLLTGQEIEIHNIRAARPKPGLGRQHLTCVLAAARISGAVFQGAEPGSRLLRFAPGIVRSGRYRFDIGTAGSVGLVFQTLFLPLFLEKRPSEIFLTGGTHVPWSPCFHYLDRVFRPALKSMGILFTLELLRWGWYPKGGGEVKALIRPTGAGLRPFRAPGERDARNPRVRVLAASSRLPGHIRARLASRIKDLLNAKGIPSEIEEVEGDAVSPGCMLFCSVCKPGCYGGFFGVGERGKPAEAVAEDVFHGIDAFLHSRATVDERLSDQLILPALLAEDVSIWTTSRLTSHLRTVAWVAGEFGLGPVEFHGPDGSNITVIVHGRPSP